ncbi:MAG: hypothetical protein ACKVX7_09255 [Planctomycetota bacterium]
MNPPVQLANAHSIASARIDSTWKVWGLVAVVLVVLFLLLVAFAFAVSLVEVAFFNPYSLTVLLCAGGSIALWFGFRDLRSRWLVQSTPTAKTSAAAIGLVELIGRTASDTVTVSPLSGLKTVYFRVHVDRWTRGPNKDDSWQWVTIASEQSAPLEYFEIEDEFGRVPVWAAGGDLLLTERVWQSDKDATAMSPAIQSMVLNSAIVKVSGGSLADKFRVRERSLNVGETVYALGTLAERGRIAPRAVRPQERKKSVTPLSPARADIAKILRIILEFIRVVGLNGATTRSQRSTVSLATEPPPLPAERVMMWKGRQSRPFIIADHSERAALLKLKSRMWLLLAGGVASLFGSLFVFLDLVNST